MKNQSFFILASLSLFDNILISQTNLAPLKYEASQGFVAHEWGTFTSLRKSNGELLSGLELEEEPLPLFAYSLQFNYKEWTLSHKGYSTKKCAIKNVTIKMETPVLYFYSPENSEKKVSVDIKFRNGSISQWYPSRASGEVVENLYTEEFSSYVPIIDFSEARTGSISWNAVVLPNSDKSGYSSDPKYETPQWVSPRETKSNLVKIKDAQRIYDPIKKESYLTDQIEKFLFYRGIANFKEPINFSFNTSGNLVITNLGKEKFSYVLVYEKRRTGKTIIWWSGLISGNKSKVVVKPLKSMIDPAMEHEKFVRKLVAAGLYEDEARAMLKTWEKSYFEHEGLKVFWIVPGAFTDEVLPIQINPQPNILKRVLIGRGEILTPEFEKELENILDSTYSNDRFSLAYKELLSQGIPRHWTDYNVLTEDEAEEPEVVLESSITEISSLSDSKNIELFPNPVTGNLVVKIYDDVEESISINIYESTGKLVGSSGKAKPGENSIEMGPLPNGIYCIKVEFADGKSISKKIIKN